MPFLSTPDGTSLHYNDWGRGRPIVLIHGWPLSGDMWEYQARPLAEAGFRVVTYDRRGFGRSSQPFEGYDYDTLSDDLAAVLDALDLEDAVLVGFSMGGGEVARFMSRNGGRRVGKAVLVAAVTPFLLKTEDNPEGVDAGVFASIIDGLKNDRAHFLAGFARQFFGAGLLNFQVSSELLQHALIVALQASPKATIDCVTAFSATDFRADLAAFTVPTLVIHGSADQTVPFEASGARAHRLLPGSQLTVYEGAPHGLHFTEKTRLNDDLIAFARV